MNVIVIEDEKPAADYLQSLIRDIDPNISILAHLDSVKKAVSWLAKNNCDLIFLDVQLSDGISFEIFEQIKVKTPIIFTTAYDHYAIKAFKVNSIDYLLKPINIEDLSQAIQKYKNRATESAAPDFSLLLDSLKKGPSYQERFLVSAGTKLKSIKTKDIAYFYILENGTFFTIKENRHYLVSQTLEKLEEILDPKYFFRINRQCIVHIDAIESMEVVSKSRLKLILSPKADFETIVSVNNLHDFRIWMNK
jgi:DNA-binding LytR/AlgR family response regulator